MKLIKSSIWKSRRKSSREKKNRTIQRLYEAFEEVKHLQDILRICSSCKSIGNDQGYWKQIDVYFSDHADVEFPHGTCPDFAQKLYPDIVKRIQEKKTDK